MFRVSRALAVACTATSLGAQAPAIPHDLVAARVMTAPVIDGRLGDPAWQQARWSEPFVDIEGPRRPDPPVETRVAIAWDDEALYLAASLEEPDLWGTLTSRDAVIYHDNDFEWFIDPDGDAARYFELEINALGTVWDLFLDRPYRAGGRADNGWDIAGLRSAVHLEGTLNDPRDRDRGWFVEMAIPWAAFADGGRTVIPPRAGDTWRINFSRVQWELDVIEGRYRKRRAASGKPLPEHNWVWSPQGEINMHVPERWGTVVFAAAP